MAFRVGETVTEDKGVMQCVAWVLAGRGAGLDTVALCVRFMVGEGVISERVWRKGIIYEVTLQSAVRLTWNWLYWGMDIIRVHGSWMMEKGEEGCLITVIIFGVGCV